MAGLRQPAVSLTLQAKSVPKKCSATLKNPFKRENSKKRLFIVVESPFSFDTKLGKKVQRQGYCCLHCKTCPQMRCLLLNSLEKPPTKTCKL